MNIFELKDTEEESLWTLARESCKTFPSLMQIYDEEFLKLLIKRRFNFNNYLLWLLVSRDDFAVKTLSDISEFAVTLGKDDFVSHFKDKLRSPIESVFNNYLTELEFAAYYKNRGYSVELEPKNGDSEKHPDFKIVRDTFQVFFEVKNIFWEEMMEMNKIETLLQGELSRVKQKYVFSIHYSPKLTILHLASLRKFVTEKLEKLTDKEIPAEFLFPNENEVLSKIKVIGKPKKLPFGYLGAVMRTEAFRIPGGRDIRRKISQKVTQLPKDEMGVIVIAPGQIFVREEHVLEALYGDETAIINLEDCSATSERIHNGTYNPESNRRLSAVIFFKRQWNAQKGIFEKNRAVFHNPFANRRLAYDFFQDSGVRQFIPIEDNSGIRMTWKE